MTTETLVQRFPSSIGTCHPSLPRSRCVDLHQNYLSYELDADELSVFVKRPGTVLEDEQ